MDDTVVLDVNHLTVSFMDDGKLVPAVENIDFQLHKGEILGIVGESGSGKSLTSLSIMGLLPQPPAIVDPQAVINFEGDNLLKQSESKMRKIRGDRISMIFQEPMTSLNPLFTIGQQMIEAYRLHRNSNKVKARTECEEMLKQVGLPRAADLMKNYPHELSGGMRQRVMIAMAMVCKPNILIADEPTTALDVTIQAQILKLMKDLNNKTETSIILITHDLGVVAEICDRVLVMYAGKIVEKGTVRDIFKNPKHPYTKGLLKSVPDIRQKDSKLYSIPGNVPKPGMIQNGCVFAPRCEYAMPACATVTPDLQKVSSQYQWVRCLLYQGQEGGIHHDGAVKS